MSLFTFLAELSSHLALPPFSPWCRSAVSDKTVSVISLTCSLVPYRVPCFVGVRIDSEVLRLPIETDWDSQRTTPIASKLACKSRRVDSTKMEGRLPVIEITLFCDRAQVPDSLNHVRGLSATLTQAQGIPDANAIMDG